MSDETTPQDDAAMPPASAGSIARDAVSRGVELAMIPMKDLPPLAMEFLRHLAKKVGMCGEVCITAFAVYAQCVEGLPCGDSLYTARPEDREWFAERVK